MLFCAEPFFEEVIRHVYKQNELFVHFLIVLHFLQLWFGLNCLWFVLVCALLGYEYRCLFAEVVSIPSAYSIIYLPQEMSPLSSPPHPTQCKRQISAKTNVTLPNKNPKKKV